MGFEPLNPNPVSEFSLDPQFSPSPGEMREILEISVFVNVYDKSLWFPLDYSLFKQIGFISQFVKYHFLFINEDVNRNEKYTLDSFHNSGFINSKK